MNSLLQGDYFTEVDLMQIARELDEQERKVMMEYGAETKEFLTFMAVIFLLTLHIFFYLE